jgi:hypothetical protein
MKVTDVRAVKVEVPRKADAPAGRSRSWAHEIACGFLAQLRRFGVAEDSPTKARIIAGSWRLEMLWEAGYGK